MRFYGYKHWTLEATPRCFYVGKGLQKRPFSDRRSSKWHSIVKRFGLRVEICVGPITNKEVIEWEVSTIKSERTYHYDDPSGIGCNFTRGGDGTPGRQVSIAARENIGDAQRGKPKSEETKQKIREALQGKKLSDVTRQRMSEAKKGRPLSIDNRQNLWLNRSRQFSDDHRKSLSQAAKSRKCSICKQTGHKRPTCPLVMEGDQHHVGSQTSDCR